LAKLGIFAELSLYINNLAGGAAKLLLAGGGAQRSALCVNELKKKGARSKPLT
jgi:hypothetical protein